VSGVSPARWLGLLSGFVGSPAKGEVTLLGSAHPGLLVLAPALALGLWWCMLARLGVLRSALVGAALASLPTLLACRGLLATSILCGPMA
jgi:hypothetical protein